MASSAASTTGYDTQRDNNVPAFSGVLAEYREYRRRIKLYMGKMRILKREAEGVLNMLGALSGTAWKLMENYDLADAEKPDAAERILKVLDKAFEYDSRVQLPQDFDKFFTHLHRRPGQTLLQYVTDFDECYRKLEEHKITLPGPVQGWHLMRRAGLSKEQRQLIVTQAPTLERNKVQEAMYLILGQDHRHVAGHAGQGDRYHRRGRAYFGEDDDASAYDPVESYEWDEQQWPEDNNDDSVYYNDDYGDEEGWEADEGFDQEAGYFGGDGPQQQHDPAAEALVFDEAYAAYLDARKRFSDLKLARGFLPVVALADSAANLSPGLSPTLLPLHLDGEKEKVKEPKARARAKARTMSGTLHELPRRQTLVDVLSPLWRQLAFDVANKDTPLTIALNQDRQQRAQ